MAAPQIVILGRDGQVLGANLPGEVALRGPSVFSGYGGGGPAAEAANLEAFEGGWFHTGDEVGQGVAQAQNMGWLSVGCRHRRQQGRRLHLQVVHCPLRPCRRSCRCSCRFRSLLDLIAGLLRLGWLPLHHWAHQRDGQLRRRKGEEGDGGGACWTQLDAVGGACRAPGDHAQMGGPPQNRSGT